MARVCGLSISVVCLSLLMGSSRTLCDDPYKLLCAIDGYDYFNLTLATWFINLDQQYCLSVNGTQPASQCTVDIAICHRISGPGLCQNSSVCADLQQGYLSLGTYRENPFGPLTTSSDVDGFQAVFPNGSRYSTGSDPCLLQTEIIFVCNKSAIWAAPGTSESRKKAPDPTYLSYSNKTCQLSLSFDYAGACQKKLLSAENMSAGTVLLAIFFVSVILYFSLGAMINLARGRFGADVIPHAKFWAMLPVYIVDGFQFVFCCGRLPVTAVYEHI